MSVGTTARGQREVAPGLVPGGSDVDPAFDPETGHKGRDFLTNICQG